jgi:hypothetical protein
MKKLASLVAALIVFSVISMAQGGTETAAANQSSAQPQAANPVSSGTLLAAELSKSLDAKKSKANDRIEARTSTDLLAHGQIIVPRNTKIIGHVTEAKARSKDSPDSVVGISFDRMLLKDGRELPLPISVQAMGRPLQAWNAPTGGSAADGASGPGPMPGARTPQGAANVGASAASQYPGTADPATSPDPMASTNSTVTPLNPTSQGLIGIKGLTINTSGSISILTSNTGNVHLDGGTQLILRVQ